MKIEHIHHLVLTVRDIETTCNFYQELFGIEIEPFSIRGKALRFGNQKINLREKRREFEADDFVPPPGVVEICLIIAEPIELVKAELENKNIKIQGVVERNGPTGKKYSVYFRDPDQHLIEVSNSK